FSWSVLAELNPYLEQTNIHRTMDLSYPLYVRGSPSYQVSPPNQFAAAQVVKLFLCPSDKKEPVSGGYGVESFGPTNYAACTGAGTNGGSPFQADGLVYANSRTRLADVTDGTRKPAAFSESTLREA